MSFRILTIVFALFTLTALPDRIAAQSNVEAVVPVSEVQRQVFPNPTWERDREILQNALDALR